MSKYLDVTRGDTATFTIKVKRGKAKEPLTGATLFFTVKEDADDLDVDALIVKETGSGISHTDVANGIALLSIDPEDTEDIAPGTYHWDSQIVTASGEVFTINSGDFEIKADITRRIT